MSQRRLHITLFLMVFAIIAVGAFQSYWLIKNYKEEKKLLQLRTNVLFRDAVNQVQLEKIELDSNIKIRVTSNSNPLGMMNAIRRRVELDTTNFIGTKGAVMITVNRENAEGVRLAEGMPIDIDSVKQTVQFFKKPGSTGLIQVLQGVDSLQDSLTIKEISTRYEKLLKIEKIDLPFTISRREAKFTDDIEAQGMTNGNEVTVGFFKPLTFSLSLQQTTSYLFRKLLQPILVSIFLVGITLISFLVLYRNLIQQRRLAEQKNEFVSNITHELKTPIATVGVAIEALKNFNALKDPERTKEYLDISSSEIHRLGLLVDKVLKLSLFENKAITLQKENVDVLQLTNEVVSSMKLQFEKQHANVSVESIGEKFIIEADKLHISSVVYNLLDNALKYSTGNPAISILLTSHKEHISLQVSDKGMGIADEYRNKIFEKFFRIPGGDRHNIKGYGLGLSYVNHIVRQHQGFIEVKSAKGEGSTFTVNIPYKSSDVVQFDENKSVASESNSFFKRNSTT